MRERLSLVIENGGCKRAYFIDNPKSLNILYCQYTNNYVVSFKQFHKQMMISTKHFQISGITYDKR